MFLAYVLPILHFYHCFSVLFLLIKKVCCKLVYCDILAVALYIWCLQCRLIVQFFPVLDLISCYFVYHGSQVFVQWQNCLTTRFSELMPISNQCLTVCITCTHGFNYHLGLGILAVHHQVLLILLSKLTNFKLYILSPLTPLLPCLYSYRRPCVADFIDLTGLPVHRPGPSHPFSIPYQEGFL